MRRNPAHCSNAAGPRRGTRFNCALLWNGPFLRRYSTMFLANAGPSPLTYVSRWRLAVLRSTPTEFTQLSTVKSRLLRSFVWSTSCWYCPTPILFGSIFTNSARGSISRLPIDTAPRTVTSSIGNSSRAVSEAEYTEAPSSLTTNCFISSARCSERTNAEVSRLAVPLPMAIASIR